jgi:hypothetical protein
MELNILNKCLWETKCEWGNQVGKSVESLGNEYEDEALYIEIIYCGSNFD